MDASNPNAKTPVEFLGGTANWRTDLYSTGGTLLSHKESIQLIKSLGAKFTPELKGPNRSAKLQVEAVFGSQEGYAQAMIDDYKAARIAPNEVFAQSFNLRRCPLLDQARAEVRQTGGVSRRRQRSRAELPDAWPS